MRKLLVTVLILSMALLTACATKTQQKSDEIVIYLVRHGKTIFNTTSQVQGWSDTPLTEVGVAGAKNVGKGLRDIRFTAAYTSDMGRARSTAKYILEENRNGNLPLIEMSGLREWFYGGYEGRDNSEMWIPIFKANGLKFDENWSQWALLVEALGDRGMADAIAKNDPLQTAETYDQIIDRTEKAVKQIIKEVTAQGGGNVLLVTHGSEIPTILEIFAPGAYKGEDINNNSVTTLIYKDGKFSTGVIGDDSFTARGKKL